MKSLVAAAATLALLPTLALAADAPDVVYVDEDAISYATSNWDGAYVGVGAGYAMQLNGPNHVASLGVGIGANGTMDQFLFGAEAYLVASYGAGTLSGAVGAKGRLGILAGDVALIYGAGGLELTSGGNLYGTVGSGVEFMIADNVSLDLEYTYYVPLTSTWRGHGVSASLNWHFD